MLWFDFKAWSFKKIGNCGWELLQTGGGGMIYKQLIYAHMKGILYDPLACKNISSPVKIQFLDNLNLTQETECPYMKPSIL